MWIMREWNRQKEITNERHVHLLEMVKNIWIDTAEHEQDNIKSNFYKSMADICIAKLEQRNRLGPESKEALSILPEEAESNDLTRVWSKENF